MLKVLLAQVKEYKADSIKTPILVMGEVVFDVLIPFLMALLVDEGINKGDMHAILLYAGLMLASAIIALILGGILYSIMPHPMLLVPLAGGLALALAGLFQDG